MKKLLLVLFTLLAMFCSCNKEGDSNLLVGTWADDKNSGSYEHYWTFMSNGDFESHLYQRIGDNPRYDQPRYGTYILNNGVLTIKIRAVAGNNGAYTDQYVVTALAKNELVVVGEDDIKSFTRD